jgi:protein-S-isoprenylcysteine O-methyltransferase Ste14
MTEESQVALKDPRKIRTRAVWLLVLPFLWFAAPTTQLIAVGAALALLGLGVRAWAAGTIHKDSDLTTSGPYAFTRNPLYVGSFLIGLGVTLAGGHWIWPVVFLAFYGLVYGRTLAYEAEVLSELFGESFNEYRTQVPAVLPRMTPYRPTQADVAGGFSFAQYRRNNEWEALLGAVAAFAFLATKGMWLG